MLPRRQNESRLDEQWSLSKNALVVVGITKTHKQTITDEHKIFSTDVKSHDRDVELIEIMRILLDRSNTVPCMLLANAMSRFPNACRSHKIEIDQNLIFNHASLIQKASQTLEMKMVVQCAFNMVAMSW
jgi:hypothetical protein